KKWLTAEGTTLGADNGVGVAASLALMKKIHENEISFKDINIDLLFTVAEEAGFFGAYQIEDKMIAGNFLINLDGERFNSITIGSAGVQLTNIEVIDNKNAENEHEKEIQAVKIKLSGLLGGHSGTEIHLGRGNAIKILVNVLWKLNKRFLVYLCSIEGGKNLNAIPRESSAMLHVKKTDLPKIREHVKILNKTINNEYAGIEDGINISIEKVNDTKNQSFSQEIQQKILNVLYLIPNGVIKMHPEIKDLVFTSTNLSSISTRRNRIKIVSSQRSFDESSLMEISEKLVEFFNLAKLKIKYKYLGIYGIWNPNFDSLLLEYAKKTFKNLFHEKPFIKIWHAGLETGVFKTKFPDLDLITIGPNMNSCHSPDERLDIESVEKFWNFLIHLLHQIR
ncbi:MAG: beta-Ala-His dipeptidase, partial [Promethearchaeota archaeon]